MSASGALGEILRTARRAGLASWQRLVAVAAAVAELPAWLFLRVLVAQIRRDELAERSAALAFITVVSLVPLMATLSLFAGPVQADDSTLFTILAWLLPYPEETLVAKLREFVDHARAIRGIGLIAFLVTALAAFFTVDHTINRIWKVGRRRPFPARLRSFTLVLFWTPVMIAVASSSRFLLDQRLDQHAAMALLDQVLVLMPLTVTVLGLSMLYWLVPFTAVGFRFALIGAACAALLLELLRKGFAVYIELYQVTRIYGSFGLAILFLISIQLGWLMVLAGCEVAYCAQNRRRLMRRTASARSSDAGWMGVAAMLIVHERFRTGSPIVSRPSLAQHLQLGPATLDAVLEPLIVEGMLVPSSDGAGYLLAADPHTLPVERIFTTYDRATGGVIDGLPELLRDRLDGLRRSLSRVRGQHLEGLTLAQAVLAPTVAKPDGVPYNAAPRVGQ